MFSEIMSIVDILVNHADHISTFLIVMGVVTAFVIWVHEYKGKLIVYVTNKRNKWWFIYLLLSFALIVYLTKIDLLSGGWQILNFILWCLYGLCCVSELKPKQFGRFDNLLLRKYEKWLREGRALEHIGFFRKTHWYFTTAEEKVEFSILKSMYYAETGDYETSYKALTSIDTSFLYNVEIKNIDTYRACLLVLMGDMAAAMHMLGEPDQNESRNPIIWFAYSFIYENKGDIDKAYQYSLKSKSIAETDFKIANAMNGDIFNNYSRIALLKGNRNEALQLCMAACKRKP